MQITPIAHIETDFSTKFGVPRQSGIAPDLLGRIVFEPEFRVAEALRGIEEFSHLWLIWEFSEAIRNTWSPTVRPPRLGGNERMGVFATRSPFRPNALALSSVKLIEVQEMPGKGLTLVVAGADLMNGTPIYDVKPYIPYTDAHSDACGGFANEVPEPILHVVFEAGTQSAFPAAKIVALKQVLALDPRPAYHDDPARVYGFQFSGFEIKFTVADRVLRVMAIDKVADEK
ncbi:MAG: tRNA (N6-threonylcarbamoyladenosine(37)-N6)-methyltransferase TrmO [Bacteroidales bacterium]|nr:tRNA (N6-threonylcarbamoyladenosine(37)-N6)-methyltransferase TrmO [Bacteroidales bacterium]